MKELEGKHGLIVGVANKRSIAWAIAKAVSAGGARLARHLPGRAARGERARAVGGSRRSADPPAATSRATSRSRRSLAKCDESLRWARFRRPWRGVRAARRARAAVRRDLARGLPHRPRRQRVLAGGAGARDGAADGEEGRRQPADADLPRRRTRVPELQRDGRRQGRARVDACATSRPNWGRRTIRVNAISAGPIKTLAASGIGGFSSILQVYRDKAPLRRNIETSEVADAAAFLLGPAGRGVTGEVLIVDGGYNIIGL